MSQVCRIWPEKVFMRFFGGGGTRRGFNPDCEKLPHEVSPRNIKYKCSENMNGMQERVRTHDFTSMSHAQAGQSSRELCLAVAMMETPCRPCIVNPSHR
jgi:hypothetical protein